MGLIIYRRIIIYLLQNLGSVALASPKEVRLKSYFRSFARSLIYLFMALSFSLSLNASTYKTYTQWEVDALMSAWLISRFVESDAKFSIVKKGSIIDKEYAINTPNSKYRRGAKETAFESVLRQFSISDSCTKSLIPIIRVVELAPWRKSEYLYILNFENEIVDILNKDGIERAFIYIDNYCKKGER